MSRASPLNWDVDIASYSSRYAWVLGGPSGFSASQAVRRDGGYIVETVSGHGYALAPAVGSADRVSKLALIRTK